MRSGFCVVVVATSLVFSGAAWSKNLVDTLVDAGTFSIFLAAVKATGLAEPLSQPGPITLLAPTDDAFAKLPKDQLDGLLKPENREKTRKLLTFHIVLGKVTSHEILGKRLEAATIEGGSRLIDATKGIKVDDARVIKADIVADNGYIQVLDTVIMPK